MYSPRRDTGSDHTEEKRPTMLPRTWEAIPNWKRPLEYFARSQAAYATIIGLRGNASTMLVRTVSCLVWVRAIAAVGYGSWIVSAMWMTSKPMRSMRDDQPPISLRPIWAGAEATISTG